VSRKRWIVAGAAIAAVAAAIILWDALVVSDEERLEALVDDITGSASPGRLDAARARWVDLERQPFELSALGEALYYRAGDDAALAQRSSEAMRTLSGSRLRSLGSGVEVDGAQARVSVRILSDRHGLAQVECTLHRHGDDWLIERLAVSR
jgi:hypothetical protein